MQEDYLGTRRSVLSSTVLVQCARCGKMTPRNQAKIVTSTTLSETTSEFEYHCPECQQAIAAGEPDLPVEP